MSNSSSDGRALAQALLEAEESPREFLKRFRPPPNWNPNYAGNKKPYGDYSLDDRGIENNQYWQGVSTVHTNWDSVYTGVADSPHEAADDAIGQAAEDGWFTDPMVNDLPEEPTVSGYIMDLAKDEASCELKEEDFETREDYDAAVEERAEEMVEEGGWEDLNYYVVLWIRQLAPQDAQVGEAKEGEARTFLKQLSREKREPYNWPVIKRWYDPGRSGTKHRRAFVTGTGWRGGERVERPYRLRNTRFMKYPRPGEYGVRFHQTDVLYYDSEGTVHINTGGWKTATTKERINTFTPKGWKLTKYQYGWYWWNQNWPQEIQQQLWADTRSRRRPQSKYWIPFNDGDKINANGTLTFNGGRDTATPEGQIGQPQAHESLMEGRYLDKLAWIKRVKAKHAKMKEVRKQERDLEKLDDRSKPKKNPMNLH